MPGSTGDDTPVRIDLHVHSKERSPGCARNTEVEMAAAARAARLDAIAFTDHERLTPPDRLLTLNEQFAPMRIFGGIEITCVEVQDCVVFGIADPVLEKGKWGYAELHSFVRRRGGYLYLAHPFRFQPTLTIDVRRFPPDGVELHSPNTPVQHADEIRAIARDLHLALLANSDAHTVGTVGEFWNEVGFQPQDSRWDLVEVLRSGDLIPMRRERVSASKGSL